MLSSLYVMFSVFCLYAVPVHVCVASGKRASLFISRGATQILLHVLVCESKDDECLSELLVAGHHLLAKLGPRGTYISLLIGHL